ncbi:MAG: MBL fold metallo-hydrolase [Sedimentisphaerales bacterium]|nr:MBL fold metallo-hydrolase [Sedimentisphaerales bacterium]
MIIDTLVVGDFETNCYCLRSDEKSQGCVLIDTGLDDTDIVRIFEEKQFTPLVLVITHGHFDHIAGLNAMREKFPDMKVYMHKLDAAALEDPNVSLACLTGDTFTSRPADLLVKEGDFIEQAGVKLQVIDTPGHTPGGISLYSPEDGVVFSGDALFAESVGRTDFPGGNSSQLIQSVKEKLLTLPEETKVYPGHGPTTTIAHEKKYNQFLM